MGDEYQTKELGVAAYLVASGIELIEVIKDGKVGYFVFPNYSACKDMENDYKYKNAFVEAKKFYEAVRNLKYMVFHGKEE